MNEGPTHAATETSGATLDHVTRNVRGISLWTLVSRVLGFVRDTALAARFGNGPLLDAFTLAFRLPNLARAVLGEGALATAFLPMYVGTKEQAGTEAARRFATAVAIFLLFAVLLLIGGLELILLGVYWGAGLSPDATRLCRLMIWLTPYLGLICLTAHLCAVLNAERRFLLPALISAILNLAWLCGLWVAGAWSDPEQQLVVMSASIVIGGLAQVVIPLWALHRQGWRYDPAWRMEIQRVGTMISQMVPVVGGMMVTQINALVDSVIAWGLADRGDPTAWTAVSAGTASALYFGQRLYQFPLGVFGVALGTVLFPLLAEHAQRRQYDHLRRDLTLGLICVAAIGFPASAGLMLLSSELTSLFFEYGSFDAADTRDTAQLVFAYASGVWAYCGLLILQRGFYALGDRMTPVRLSVLAVLANMVSSLILVWWLGGVALALTTAVIAMGQCVIAGWLLFQKAGGFHSEILARGLARAAMATLVMVVSAEVALLLLADVHGWGGRAFRVVIPLGVAVITYLGTAWAMRFEEPWLLLGRRSQYRSVTE